MRRDAVCYLCGKRATTKDHVPPRTLFPKPRPSNLITLPCCAGCNRLYSLDEEHFRTNIAMLSNPQHASQIWQACKRSFEYRPKLRAEVLSRISPTRFGDLVLPVVRYDAKRTNRVLIKIALGLLHHHTGRRLPKSVRRNAYLAEEIPSSLRQVMKKLPCRGRWGETFAYLGGMTDDDPNYGIWVLTFYVSKVFLVELGSPE